MTTKKTMKYATIRDIDPASRSLVLNCSQRMITISLSKEDYDWLSRIRRSAFSFGISLSEAGPSEDSPSKVGLEVVFSVKMTFFHYLDPKTKSINISIAPAEADKDLITETIQKYDKRLWLKTRSDGKSTFHVPIKGNVLDLKYLSNQFDDDMYPDAGSSSTK